MSTVTRPAGVLGSFSYTLYEFELPGGPFAAPKLTIYSNAARTVVAVAEATLVATSDPNKFTASYPASLAAGTYYLKFVTEIASGDTFTDLNDTLILEAVSGSVAETGIVCSPWTTSGDVRGCIECADIDEDVDLDEFISAASDFLYQLSGQQYPGQCTASYRPCKSCPCRDSSACRCAPTIVLPHYPIISISSVRIDGDLLSDDEYRLDHSRELVRLEDADGNNEGWECCQRLDRPTTGDDTFEITYVFGGSPPPIGAKAAAALACQLYLSCNPGAGQCKLPDRVTSLTRQGVTVAMIDPTNLLEAGRTGIYEVDLFLHAVNPFRLQRRARVLSPDV